MSTDEPAGTGQAGWRGLVGLTPGSSVAAWWQNADHRLRLFGLPQPALVRVQLGLAVAAIAGVLILLLGIGVDLPGGEIDSKSWAPVSRLLIAFGFAAFAIVQLLLARAAMLSRAPLRWLILGSSALVNAALGSGLVVVARDVGEVQDAGTVLTRTSRGLVEVVPYAGAATRPVAVAGWTILAAAVALALLPARASRGRLVDVLAVGPWLVGLAAFLVVDRGRIPEDQLETIGWSESLQAAVGFAGVNVITALALCVFALFLWQAVEAATAARDVGVVLARVASRVRIVFLALLALKLVWISLGYAGVLPAVLGGESGMWDGSANDDWAAWALAALLAGAAGLTLTTARSPDVSERGFRGARVFLVAGFMAPWVAAAFAVLATFAFAVWEPAREPFESVASWLGDYGIWSGVMTVGIALAVAVVGLATDRWRAWGAAPIFLLAFALWALPRTLAIGVDRDDPPHFASTEVVTLDTALTVMLAVLVLRSWLNTRRGTRTSPNPAVMLLVLGASTAACYAGFLFEASPGAAKGIAFSVALIFPAAYFLAADARALNEVHPNRERRLLVTVAVIAGLLTLVAFLVGLEVLAAKSEDATIEDFGRVVFVVPLAALLVSAASRELGEDARGAPS